LIANGCVSLQGLFHPFDLSSPQASNTIFNALTAHDFFMPQPVKAAAVYCARFILHDWDFSKGVQILKNLHAAASPSSKLVIWDLFVPNACRSLHSKTDASLLPPGLDWATSIDMQVCAGILCWLT
jgi:O-methyltransferase domain